jgi:hypothetical protein
VRVPGVRLVVLIVHEDLGFVCWLGELLAQDGCQAVPALNSRDAVRIAEELDLPIDVAIIDPSLRGIAKAIRILSDQHPSLRTIAVRTPGQDAIEPIDAKATLARPFGSARMSPREGLRSIRRALKDARTAA